MTVPCSYWPEPPLPDWGRERWPFEEPPMLSVTFVPIWPPDYWDLVVPKETTQDMLCPVLPEMEASVDDWDVEALAAAAGVSEWEAQCAVEQMCTTALVGDELRVDHARLTRMSKALADCSRDISRPGRFVQEGGRGYWEMI